MVTHFGLGKTPAFGWQRRGNDGRKLYECDPAGALMTVYVDAARIPANVPNGGRVVRGTWSHMTADTRAELDAMADRIGLKRQWIQYPGTPKEHYDVTESRRAAAVAAGAVEVDTAFTVAVVKRKAIAYAGAAPSSFVAIDFETCMAKRASPIQIGVVRVYEGQIGRKNTSPVLPPEKFRRFEAHAKKIHKLEKDYIVGAPEWPEIMERLVRLATVDGLLLPLVAHNAAFERAVIAATSQETGIAAPPFEFFDTVKYARRVVPNAPNHKLNTLVEHLGLGDFQHHDAGEDALMTARLLLHLRGIESGAKQAANAELEPA